LGGLLLVTAGALVRAGVGQEPVPPAVPQQEMVIPSPMSGLFTAGEMPGGPPSVKVGDHVTSGTVLGVVDNMPVRAMVTGTVTAIMVQDGQMVTAGEGLFRIRTP
jgi:acetyl-CoA carboxylase biotin carboxyl carrier protein